MTQETQSSLTGPKFPLQGVIIFVSQQLATSRTTLHQQCTALGGKFVWMFDVPFTHYICQGKLSKRGKEYRKVEEYRATCVHPAWLKACQTFGQHVAEKLYASTYDPNRSLTFVAVDDDDENEENHVPLLTTIKRIQPIKSLQTPRMLPVISRKKQVSVIKPAPLLNSSSPQVTHSPCLQPSSQLSNEAETMLSDLESSLAQFLNNNLNTPTSRSANIDEESHKKSHPIIRTISNMNHQHHHGRDLEPSMRVEWLDDAMQAERKKMIDEDEHGGSSQPQVRCTEANHGKKRALLDSNFDPNFNAKKCRI